MLRGFQDRADAIAVQSTDNIGTQPGAHGSGRKLWIALIYEHGNGPLVCARDLAEGFKRIPARVSQVHKNDVRVVLRQSRRKMIVIRDDRHISPPTVAQGLCDFLGTFLVLLYNDNFQRARHGGDISAGRADRDAKSSGIRAKTAIAEKINQKTPSTLKLSTLK
nr:hypothetical protein [uncultured Aliiroseovarius sp.]